MMRRPIVSFAIGTAAFVAAIVWTLIAGESLLPSYLAAWLVWAGTSLGALIMLLVIEAGGEFAVALSPLLRVLARGMPFAAVLFIPILLRLHVLYPWAGGKGTGAPFGEAWLHPWFFAARTIFYFIVLSLLAIVFASDRVAGSRRNRALAALFVVALVATLSAVDWFMSLDPALHSGEFGLLIIGLACATAVAGSVLIGSLSGALSVSAGTRVLAGVGAIWLYLHFMQFLVMWSGDLPHEVEWYMARGADAGHTIEWFAFVAAFVLPMALLAAPADLQTRTLPVVAGAALLAHMAEALWFVTPALRRHFALRGPDVLMMLAFSGIAVSLLWRHAPQFANTRRTAA